jgi:hypothetical protein
MIGGLFAGLVTSDFITILGSCLAGAIAGIVLLIPLRLMLFAANPAVRKEHGYAGIRRAVGAGYVAFVPFALLATVAELLLGWDALTAFAIAGMMAGSGAAALEVARLGGKPIPSLLIGVLHGFGLSMIWTFLMLVVQTNG